MLVLLDLYVSERLFLFYFLLSGFSSYFIPPKLTLRYAQVRTIILAVVQWFGFLASFSRQFAVEAPWREGCWSQSVRPD